MSVGSDNAAWVRPLGSATDGDFPVAITPATTHPVPGWRHTRLRVAHLERGSAVELESGTEETLVVPLAGTFRVEVTEADGTHHDVVLTGRASPFDGSTDVAYAGRGSHLRVSTTASDAGRVALCGAVTSGGATTSAGAPTSGGEPGAAGGEPRPFRHVTASEVGIELRGTGAASREVRNLGLPDVLDAQRLLVCEVLTPAGNWSSWPPHKHDEERPGQESALEEIYYVETRSTDPRGTDPTGYLRVYGACDARPIDVLTQVRSGDVVLVPHGWHGPAVASPDADLYYLNVMAGPGAERAWRICEDPAHAWVREAWGNDAIDPRLPVGGTG